MICAETAHINVDENGAPERVGGLKLLTGPHAGRQADPGADRPAGAAGFGDEHRAQPLAVSITQTTELGTAYTPEEIRAIADHVHALGMRLHVDGSRIANAAATLGLPLRAFTTDAGVDVLSLRRHEERAARSREAVVVLNPDAATGPGLPAQDGHAAGLQDAVRLRPADRAAGGRPVAALRAATPTRWPAGWPTAVREPRRRPRHPAGRRPTACSRVLDRASPTGCASASGSTTGIAATGEVRWMCAFDTTEDDVDAFVAAIAEELAR